MKNKAFYLSESNWTLIFFLLGFLVSAIILFINGNVLMGNSIAPFDPVSVGVPFSQVNILTAQGVIPLFTSEATLVHSGLVESGLFYGHSEVPIGVCLSEPVTSFGTHVKGTMVCYTINDYLTYIFDTTNGEFVSSFDPENFAELQANW